MESSPSPLYGYGGSPYKGQSFDQSSQFPRIEVNKPYQTNNPLPSWTTGFFYVGDFDSVTTDSWGDLSTTTTSPTTTEEWSWTWDRTLKAMVLSPIVLFTIIGNFFVLYAFVTRKRDLRAPTHFFIANLSLADFLVGILAMPFLATLHTTDRWYFGPGFCYAWVIIHFWLCSASILSTLAVCVERYVGVKYPLRHVEIMNKPRVIGMMLGVWGMAGFLSIVSVLAFPEPDGPVGRFGCRLNNQVGHVLIATIGILYIPAGLMIFLYWRIYVVASTHLKAMKNSGIGGGPTVPRSTPRPPSKTKTWSKLNFFRLSGPSSSSTDQDNSSSSTFEKSGGDGEHSSTVESGFSSFGPEESSGGQQPQPPPQSHSATIKRATTTPTQSIASLDRSRKQINLAKRLAFLVGILLLSYIPFFTAFLIRAFSMSIVPNPLFTILGWIRYSNSALNPIIYAWAVPAYRKAFLSMWNNGVRIFRSNSTK